MAALLALASGCSSTSDPSLSAESGGIDQPATIQNGPIIVASGAERDLVLLIDPADGSSTAVERPSDIVGPPAALRAIAGPSGDYAIVVTRDDAYLIEVRTGAVRHPFPLGELWGASPEAVLFDGGDRYTLVDLRTGVFIDAGVSSPGGAFLAVDSDSRTSLVLFNGRGGHFVDLATSVSEPIPEEIRLGSNALHSGGRRIAGIKQSGPGQRELVVFDGNNPAATEIWFATTALEDQLADYAWIGDRVVAVDQAGTVLVVDGQGVQELGRLGDGDVGMFGLHVSEKSGGALVSSSPPGGEQWYRVDPTAQEIQEVSELAGLQRVASIGTPDALFLGQGDGSIEWSRVVVAPIDSGEIVDLVELESPAVLKVTDVGPPLVQVIVVETSQRSVRLVDVSDGTTVDSRLTNGVVLVSPDGEALVLTPDPFVPTVVVQDIGDSSSARQIAEGIALVWLPN